VCFPNVPWIQEDRYEAMLGWRQGPRSQVHPRPRHATHAASHSKVVQERLGYAKVSTTMDLYTHVMSTCRKMILNKLKQA
jgi:site-specific recombinase XerC